MIYCCTDSQVVMNGCKREDANRVGCEVPEILMFTILALYKSWRTIMTQEDVLDVFIPQPQHSSVPYVSHEDISRH